LDWSIAEKTRQTDNAIPASMNALSDMHVHEHCRTMNNDKRPRFRSSERQAVIFWNTSA